MRRLLLALTALSLLGALVGCKSAGPCVRGACDCEFDDHCYSRQPWVGQGGTILGGPSAGGPIVTSPGGTVVTPPNGTIITPGPAAPSGPIMPPATGSLRTMPHGS